MRYSWWILDNILHQLRLYKVIMQITGLHIHVFTIHHHGTPQISRNFYLFTSQRPETSSTKSAILQKKICSATMNMYTIHPQSSWNFRWKIPFWYLMTFGGFRFLTSRKALVNRASTSSINRIVTYRSRKKHPWGWDIVMGHGAWWKWKSFWSEISLECLLGQKHYKLPRSRGLRIMHFLYLQECILTSVSAGSRNNTVFSIVNAQTVHVSFGLTKQTWCTRYCCWLDNTL